MEKLSEESLNAVRQYWSKNPVHSVEFKQGGDLKPYFDSIDQLRWSDNELWAKDTFYDLPGDSSTKILDGGCGVGVFCRYYARKGFQVTGIDLTPTAIEMTKKSFEIYGLKGDIREASVEDVPFSDNTFDYVVSNGVIHHTPKTEKAVSEFYRVLKPGGKASICIYYKNFFLREPGWSITRFLLPKLLKKKEGREMFLTAKTPEEFVKVYDGNNTPIAKVYTQNEADELFSPPFTILTREPHFFPARFLQGLKVGGMIHKVLDKNFGTLIYYLLEKPDS